MHVCVAIVCRDMYVCVELLTNVGEIFVFSDRNETSALYGGVDFEQ